MMKTIKNNKIKLAFTMLELVMVIVVLGILGALAIPRFDRDLNQEAADSILSDIRYTQHIALLDNKHKFDKSKWQRRFWKIMFGTCTGTDRFYMIGSDDDMSANNSSGFFSKSESITDPSNGKHMFWTNGIDCSNVKDTTISDRIFITKKYGITNISTSGGCASNKYIGFDYLGRPRNGFATSTTPNDASYMSTDCTFTFTMYDGTTFAIQIDAETGYAFIVGQPNS